MRILKLRNRIIGINRLKNRYFLGMLCFILMLSTPFVSKAEPRVQGVGEELVIVIDPGHGGENQGTIQNGFEEKQMTLITALAMYKDLIQYDNVTVYMTRNDDRDLTLKERAEFAASVNADFLFSLHYNASENHTHFGSEIWISCMPPYHAYGYQFGYAFMKEMEDMGLFLRGIKTRINDEGTDYYGVIRESAALSVPAVILEHCHVDEKRDVPYCETEEEWVAFGKRDALAVAKYFGLSSQALGVDYSQESLNLPKANEANLVQSTLQDQTSPDVCMLELYDVNYETGEVMVNVTATDYDTPLLYYTYSIDGGETYCTPIEWPDVNVLEGTYTDSFTLAIQIPSGKQPEIILRAYNKSDLYTESNTLPFLQEFWYGDKAFGSNSVIEESTAAMNELTGRERHTAGTTTFTPLEKEVTEAEEEVSFLTFLKLCLIFVVIIFFAVIISQSISYNRRRRRRRQRIKELENMQNHPR